MEGLCVTNVHRALFPYAQELENYHQNQLIFLCCYVSKSTSCGMDCTGDTTFKIELNLTTCSYLHICLFVLYIDCVSISISNFYLAFQLKTKCFMVILTLRCVVMNTVPIQRSVTQRWKRQHLFCNAQGTYKFFRIGNAYCNQLHQQRINTKAECFIFSETDLWSDFRWVL